MDNEKHTEDEANEVEEQSRRYRREDGGEEAESSDEVDEQGIKVKFSDDDDSEVDEQRKFVSDANLKRFITRIDSAVDLLR